MKRFWHLVLVVLMFIPGTGHAGFWGSNEPANQQLPAPPKSSFASMWTTSIETSAAEKLQEMLINDRIRQAEHLDGFDGVELLRREVGPNTEFTIVTRWKSLEALKQFAGKNSQKDLLDPHSPLLLFSRIPVEKAQKSEVTDRKAPQPRAGFWGK